MWKPTRDTDARGNPGWRIDSEDVSLIAWLPDGAGASDQEANAHLIAAAPDMLDMLRLAYSEIEGAAWSPERGEVLKSIRAAIAKATGGAV